VLTLVVQESPQVTVLRCSGRIVRGDGADALRRVAMSQDKDRVVLDLSAVRAIDAAGLGVLVELQNWADNSNRTLQLLKPCKRVREILESTKLNFVFEILPMTRAADDAA
jgi:anti-anti-sigma factor